MGRRPRLRILIPAVAVALLVVFAVVGVLSRGGLAGTASEPAANRASAALDAAGSAGAGEAVQGVGADTASKSTGGDIAAAVPPASAFSTHHLVRTGDLSLLVARGTLLSSVDRINAMTLGMGGYVMSSAIGSESPGMPGPVEPLPLDGISHGVDVALLEDAHDAARAVAKDAAFSVLSGGSVDGG